MRRILVVGLLLLSCGKSKDVCRREAEELAEMFWTMDSHRGIPTRSVKLVLRDDLPIATDESGPVLELSSEGVTNFAALETPQGIDAVLESLLQRWPGPRRPAVLLAIDAATPWGQVVAVLQALQNKQFKELSLVFARKPPAQQPPPHSSIDERIAAIEKDAQPSEKATQLARVMSEVVKDCESIKTLFSSVTGQGDNAQLMMNGIPPALIECNCKCDVRAVQSMMFRILANRAPTTSLHLKLGGEGALFFPADVTWAEASTRLSSATRMLNAQVR